MLERVLQSYDRTKLTHQQIAHIAPLKEELRQARNALNLMARSEVVFESNDFMLYPHPDKRQQGGLMVYDRRKEVLHIETPFTDNPAQEDVSSWLDTLT